MSNLNFLKEKENKIRNYIVIILFISTTLSSIPLPNKLQCFMGVTMVITSTLYIISFLMIGEYTKYLNKKEHLITKERLIKIRNELMVYIPFFFSSQLISYFLVKELSEKSKSVNNLYIEDPVFTFLYIAFICPILEELVFRCIPHKFIKNGPIYIVSSAFVFSSIHVIGQSHPIRRIFFYILISIYLGYRYHKTNDILVTISMHIFSNFTTLLCMILLI